jgi:glyoxylase-like metal-dependent hydrolase (beta-lactamase superfamily II)
MTPDHVGIEVTGQLQHQAWLSRRLPPLERLAEDLWSVPVPIPDNPLRYVSVYVLAGPSALTLIDAGWDSDEAWDHLIRGLAEIGASIGDVSGVLVTHQHFDHIGLARRITAASGAWVGMHPADRDAIMRPEYRQADLARRREREWLVYLGAPPQEAARVVGDEHDPRGRTVIPDRDIEDGDILELPGWSLRAVHTPGHTPGHLCFADRRSGRFFSGDHILPRISPNISADRRPGVDALGCFLASLEKVGELAVGEVLPAHEWRFRGLRDRVAQLRDHHERRLAELAAIVAGCPGSVPWELAGLMSWSRPWDQYDGFMRISAVGEPCPTWST